MPMLDSIKNFSNLDFLVPFPFHPPMSYPPKCLIFIDHKLSTAGVAQYLNSRLPEAVRRVFKFKHLHSSMSQEHNEMVFDNFRKPDGVVQGVVATSGASTVTILQANILFR
jgi:superfamily II DNA/RNA helicase